MIKIKLKTKTINNKLSEYIKIKKFIILLSILNHLKSTFIIYLNVNILYNEVENYIRRIRRLDFY